MRQAPHLPNPGVLPAVLIWGVVGLVTMAQSPYALVTNPNPARNQPVYSKEQFIQKSFRHYMIRSIKGYLEGKGQQQILESS